MVKRKVGRRKTASRHSPRKLRMTKTDMIVATIMQDYAHESTHSIGRHRAKLMFEQDIRDSEITELQARLVDARRNRSETTAKLHGLGLIIGRRG